MGARLGNVFGIKFCWPVSLGIICNFHFYNGELNEFKVGKKTNNTIRVHMYIYDKIRAIGLLHYILILID